MSSTNSALGRFEILATMPFTEDQIDRSARRVMAKHSPAYFVIDRHHNIVRFSGGETGRYLEPSDGSARLNFFANLAKALRSQVRRAVETTFASGIRDKPLARRSSCNMVHQDLEPVFSFAVIRRTLLSNADAKTYPIHVGLDRPRERSSGSPLGQGHAGRAARTPGSRKIGRPASQ